MSKMNIKVHESVDDPSIPLYNKLKAALPGIEATVKKNVEDKELDNGYWLHTDVEGVLDDRISSTTDADHYDLDDYEFDEGDGRVVRCLMYRLTADPGVYADDGSFDNDNNMSSSTYNIYVEIDPAGEDFCVEMSEDVAKFGSASSPVGSKCFDADDVDYAIERIADVIQCRLNGDNCSFY